jgi:hypothetical protein
MSGEKTAGQCDKCLIWRETSVGACPGCKAYAITGAAEAAERSRVIDALLVHSARFVVEIDECRGRLTQHIVSVSRKHVCAHRDLLDVRNMSTLKALVRRIALERAVTKRYGVGCYAVNLPGSEVHTVLRADREKDARVRATAAIVVHAVTETPVTAPRYFGTIYDTDPTCSTGTGWRDFFNHPLEADCDETALDAVECAMARAAAMLLPSDGYTAGQQLHAAVRRADGSLVGRRTYTITPSDLRTGDLDI